MSLEELYKEYGKACVNLEVAQNRHTEIKRAIAAELQKQGGEDVRRDDGNNEKTQEGDAKI